MSDSLITLLQWLVPSGGLGAVIVWLTNRTLRNTRTTKEVHDTYKTMYEDVQSTLIKLRDDNEKIYKAFTQLERAVSRASVCRNWDTCPVRAELRIEKAIYPHRRNTGGSGQYHNRNPDRDYADGAAIECESGDSDTEPP